MSDVTRILSQIESGDPSAAEQILPRVPDEVRQPGNLWAQGERSQFRLAMLDALP